MQYMSAPFQPSHNPVQHRHGWPEVRVPRAKICARKMRTPRLCAEFSVSAERANDFREVMANFMKEHPPEGDVSRHLHPPHRLRNVCHRFDIGHADLILASYCN